MTPEERDADVLARDLGDFGDMLNPGPEWQALSARRAAALRRLKATAGLAALFEGLTAEERRDVLEGVLRG